MVVQSSLETESWIVKQNFWDNEIVFDTVAVKDIYLSIYIFISLSKLAEYMLNQLADNRFSVHCKKLPCSTRSH